MLSEKIPFFILDLLQSRPAVEIAGLGRFEAIFHPAVVDSANAQVRPPYLQPGFSEKNGEPNQVLERYIQYVTGADTDTTSEAIRDFVKLIQEETTGGKTFSIDKFGTFTKNEYDALRFTPDWDAFNLSFRGLEVLDLNPASTSFTSPPVPPEPVTDTDFSSSGSDPLAEELIAETESHTTATTTVFASDIDEQTSKLWWGILISALALIAVLCVYLAWDILSTRQRLNEYKPFHYDTTGIVRTPIGITPEASEENTTDSSNLPADHEPKPSDAGAVTSQPDTTKPLPSNEGECFVVVGAFSQNSNVMKMMDRLRDLGYTPKEIVGGSLTRVAIRTNCEKENLQKTLDDARTQINPDAWIY